MKTKVFNALLCSSMLLSGAGLPVAAQEVEPMAQSDVTIVHSGKIGTADWTIDSNGVLTIGEGEFTNNDKDYSWPWREYLDSITSIDGTAVFKIVGSLSGAFNDKNDSTDTLVESINLSGWDVSAVTDMSGMFYACYALSSLDISNWNTSAVTDMSYMFYFCHLSSLDVSNWNTSAVTNMSHMFRNCSSLTSLDVSNWNTSAVTNMSGMFSCCRNLTSLDVGDWNTSAVTDMSNMFSLCWHLSSINLRNWNTSATTDMNGMFTNCTDLTSLAVNNWDTSAVTDMSYMFENCESLSSLDISNWDTSAVTNMSFMFMMDYKRASLDSLDVSNWDTSAVTDMHSMFNGFTTLASLDVSNWNTSSVTDMSQMFYDCHALAFLDVSKWDTSVVTTMHSMFNSCWQLATLNLSNWDTSAVTDMHSMFGNCFSLTSIDVSNWNASAVTNMDGIFYSCDSLTEIRYSQNARRILNQLRSQSGWYQNNKGPYDISELPIVPDGQTAWLTRTASGQIPPGVDPDNPNISYELVTSVNNNDPAIVQRGNTISLNVQLKQDGQLADDFDMEHRQTSDIEVSVDHPECLEIKDCYFHLNGTPIFVATFEGKEPGRAIVKFIDKITKAETTKEIRVLDDGSLENRQFNITEDFFSFKNFGSTSKKYWET